MLLHQLGHDFVLLVQLGLQELDLAVLAGRFALVLTVGLLKHGRPALEEQPQPAVEHGDADVQLLANLRDRHLLDQVPPQVGDLLLGRNMLTRFFGHRNTSGWGLR